MAGTRKDRFGPHGPCLGIDVGESSRWVIAVDAGGGIVIDRPPPNRQPEIDAPLGEAGDGAGHRRPEGQLLKSTPNLPLLAR